MDANQHEILLKDEVYLVVDCVLEVMNAFGYGLKSIGVHLCLFVVQTEECSSSD